MRTSMICAAVVLAGAATLLRAEGDNQPKEPAKTALAKAVKATGSQEGYHFKLRSSNSAADAMGGQGGGGGGGGINAKGIYKKAPGWTRLEDERAGEIWMKGRKMLVKQPKEDKWKAPESLGGAGSMLTRLIRTPGEIADDMVRVSATAKYEADEVLDQIDCTVISAAGDKDTIKEFIKAQVEKMEGLGKMWAGAGVFDTDKAELTYRVWVSKEEGLIYRIEQHAVIPTKSNGGGGLMGMAGGQTIDQTVASDFLLYNRDLDVEIPAVIKTKLGIK